MLIAWALFGALIGAAAAQKKGFALAGGIIGGLLLGPLAVLLFFVSGISRADANNKKCPHCAEWIKGEATICKHCHQPVTAAAAPRPVQAEPQPRPAPIAVPRGRHPNDPRA
jgi:hypothetical protein